MDRIPVYLRAVFDDNATWLAPMFSDHCAFNLFFMHGLQRACCLYTTDVVHRNVLPF